MYSLNIILTRQPATWNVYGLVIPSSQDYRIILYNFTVDSKHSHPISLDKANAKSSLIAFFHQELCILIKGTKE